MDIANGWVYDIETYSNCFTLVARALDSNLYEKFVMHESRDDYDALMDWLNTKPFLIGFNTINFDAQIIEQLYRQNLSGNKLTSKDIYDFKEDLIERTNKDRFDTPFSEWDFSFKTIDLYRINHYDNPNKRTSLKWIEFTTRWKKMADLPISPHLTVPKSKVSQLLTYNRNDVDVTYDFFYRCKPMIDLRWDLKRTYRQPRIQNMSDSSIGSYIFEHKLVKDYGINKRTLKKGTHPKTIHGKDLLLDYISFESPEFQKVYDTFKSRTYENVDVDGIKSPKYEQLCLFQDMIFVFGSGGLHACYKAGEYKADDKWAIATIDVKSYYPWLAIANKFYPEHIGPTFTRIYKELYDERGKYPKGTAMNYAIKIALNSVYGKSNEFYSLMFDPSYTLKITVNGQLLLSMLAEQLAKLGRLLTVNTDGIEIMIPRDRIDEMNTACGFWEAMTGLELEYGYYDKMIIKDVNNYIALSEDGFAKRKGMFEIYDDITGEDGSPHQYHKAIGATIIRDAIFNYYAKDIPIHKTVEGDNDIYNFCYGIKKRKGFHYWLIKADERGRIDIDKKTDRVLRYFISPEGFNIYKFWEDNRKANIQAVNKGELVTLATNVRNSDIHREVKKHDDGPDILVQYDVDRDYYIDKAQEVIDHINSRARDKAYIKYMKALDKVSKVTEVLNS